MAITVACVCGKNLSVRNELAGRRVKFPACQQSLRIPNPTSIPDPEDALNDLDLDDLKGLPSLRSPKRRRNSARGQRSKIPDTLAQRLWQVLGTPKAVAGISVLGMLCIAFLAGLMIPTLMSVYKLGLLLIFLVIGLSGVVVAGIGGILMLVCAFEEDFVCGLMCLIVPLYPLYYMISRWDKMGAPKITAAGIGMSIAGPLLITLLMATAGPSTHANPLAAWEGRSTLRTWS